MRNLFTWKPFARLRPMLLLLFCSFSLLFLTGCVYLRLLEFKNQLAKFDKNFWTEVKDGFVLHFNNPMIYDKDVTYLSKIKPSDIKPEGEGERWTFRFKKIEPVETEKPTGPDVGFEMFFHKDMLTELKFSKEFFQVIPPKFMELSLRSLGHAKVDTKNRRVTVDSLPLEKKDFNLPHRTHILGQLGAPNQTVESPEGYVVTYLYQHIGTTPKSPKDERGQAITTLYFDRQTEELIQAKCKFAGLKISIDYKKWKDKVMNS